MKQKTLAILVQAAAVFSVTASAMADTGPSTTTAPYVQPMIPGLKVTSILTTGDAIGASGYRMGGIPDGLGAYDNGDGTFTLLMNHELGKDLGLTRAHGGKGAYVSKWVIDKITLEVLSGDDLMKQVYRLDGSNWVQVSDTEGLAFNRFCSADLPPQSAFYSKGKGTRNRIFLNGEESNPAQRGMAHVATGPDAGKSFVLPWTIGANGSWENLLANPYSGRRTVVIGNADGGTNGVYVYVGEKSNSGNDVERAGLVGGKLYRVSVNGNAAETQASDAGLGLTLNSRGNYAGTFTLIEGPDTGNAASTKFLRPEDGAWDTKIPNRYYFVTTDTTDAAKDGFANPDLAATKVGRSRLWSLTFKDSLRPELGGSIEMLIDGTVTNGETQMLDNITVNDDGTLILMEDVGNNRHNGKIWRFDPETGDLVKLTRFDTAFFGDLGTDNTLLPNFITKDEESSGVIDVTEILGRKDGRRYNLFVAQVHDEGVVNNDPALVEGGQLLLMSQPSGDRKGKREDDDGRSGGDRDRDAAAHRSPVERTAPREGDK